MALKFNPFTGNFDNINTKDTEILYTRADGQKKNIDAASDTVAESINDLDDAIGSLTASPTNYTPTNSSILSDHLSGIDTELGILASTTQNFEWQSSVISATILDPTPLTPTTGDRYLINGTGAGAWTGQNNDIAEWNGSAWTFSTPTTGTFVASDAETDLLYQFGGSTWSAKNFESTTASGFLSKSGFDIQLTNLNSSHVIIGSAGNVATSIDTSSVGQIQATTTFGLTINNQAITNGNINDFAGIALTKLQALTAERALQTNASGFLATSSVTNTELSFVSGVTSSIQTQLDAKAVITDVFSVNATSGTATLVVNETYIVNTSGAAATLTLPAPTINGFVRLKDNGNSNTNNITVLTAGAETIDGQASDVINSDYASVNYVSDGTNWYRM